MLTLKQGSKLVKLARKAIESAFSEKKLNAEEFVEKNGVFVSLHTHPENELRGCIGFVLPVLPLGEAIIRAAKAAAFSDPRFLPLQKDELREIVIEVSVLTEPKLIECKNSELPKNIEIGKDGLICNYRGISGLLLPQVASEQKWNAMQFLEATCEKAGLPPSTWQNAECKFFKFQAQIFSEEKPKGKVVEKR